MSKLLATSLVVVCCYLAVSAAPAKSYLREGDIRVRVLPKSLGENVNYKKWTRGIVPYEISSNYSNYFNIFDHFLFERKNNL